MSTVLELLTTLLLLALVARPWWSRGQGEVSLALPEQSEAERRRRARALQAAEEATLRAERARRRHELMSSLAELEYDVRMNKVAAEDYAALRSRIEQELAQLEAGRESEGA